MRPPKASDLPKKLQPYFRSPDHQFDIKKANRTRERKAANRQDSAVATSSYRNTDGLPHRKAQYVTNKGTYSGRDVRQAVHTHYYANARGGVGFNSTTGKPAKPEMKHPKVFENRPNSDRTRPFPDHEHGNGTLREFPVMGGRPKGYDGRKPNPSATRVIMTDRSLRGVVSHPPGSDDHARVHPTYLPPPPSSTPSIAHIFQLYPPR